MGKTSRRITCKNILALIQFSQNLMQRGWINKDPLQQLPFFDAIEDCHKLKQLLPQGGGLYQYSCLPQEERKQIFFTIFGKNEERFLEQEKVIESLPLVNLQIDAYVPGEEDVIVGDMLTCKLRVDYKNLNKGEQSGYVHSKHYPYLRRDTWYLIITDETLTGLAAVEKLNVEEDFFEKEYQERITRAGPINFTAILCNDCYKGLDQHQKRCVNITATSTIRKDYKYKKADIRGIKDTAIFFKRDPDQDSEDSE